MCELKEEEFEQKGQAAAAQAPAIKRRLTGEEPAPRKRRLLPSPPQQNRSPVKILTRAMEMKRKRMKKKRTRKQKPPKARRQRRQQRNQGPREPGVPSELHSSSQPVNPHQESYPQSQLQRVRCPWLNLWVLSWRPLRRKSNFFVCCDILCARARARHCSSTTFLLSLWAACFTMCCIFLRCCLASCARLRT